MHRRKLLSIGLGAAALIAAAGGGLALFNPGISEGRLSADATVVFRAVATAVLDKSLPTLNGQREVQLQAHLQRLNVTVAAFPPATQNELSRLLILLSFAPTRSLLFGLNTTWAEADIPEIQLCLERMRLSPLKLRQQVYHALRDLTNAAYYADPIAWPLMGYPGPVAI